MRRNESYASALDTLRQAPQQDLTIDFVKTNKEHPGVTREWKAVARRCISSPDYPLFPKSMRCLMNS